MTRLIWILAATLSIGPLGCSHLDAPDASDAMGTVVLRFVADGSASAMVGGSSSPSLSQALAVADSVAVCVYRPGQSGTPEACAGDRITQPADTVTLALTVTAETHKRVAVELFDGGTLVYFGLDEDVDVVAGSNTDVSIVAHTFQIPLFGPTAEDVTEGTPFHFVWSSVPGASSYRFQQSRTPNFSVVDGEISVVDTLMVVPAGTLSKGKHWFRVAAENVYTMGAFSHVERVDVYGAPVVTRFVPDEMIRGGEVTVFGEDLDHPSTEVSLFDLPCDVIAAARDSIRVRVPARSFTSNFIVTNDAGSTPSNQALRVQTIAYVMGNLGSGISDAEGALIYKAAIDAYGDVILNSTVAVVPYPWIDLLDMSVFDVIIVGWDTGASDTDWAGGESKPVNAIRNSGAMVLGMGLGGASYFELAGLDIGIKQTQSSFHRDVGVVDPGLSIYKTPNPIPVPGGDRVIDIYRQSEMALSVEVDTPSPPSGVTVYAAKPPLTTLFTFVGQDVVINPGQTRNFLWGFHAFPGDDLSAMSSEGKLIFANVIKMLFDAANPAIEVPID